MPQRLSYEDSCRQLQKLGWLAAGTIPPLPHNRPRYDDETLGVSFFRTILADEKLEQMTLPYTFFGRSEIRKISFHNTDLSGSTANWNDFIDVNFSGANLAESDLRACLFENVRFTAANLAGVDFRYCGFKKCDFTDANLEGARLTQKTGRSLGLTPEQQSLIDWQAEDGEEPPGG